MSSVLIYTTRTCPYCYRAKDLLESKGIIFKEIVVDNSPSIRQEMINLSGRYTVPQIFIDGQSIGVSDELRALNYKGELDEMLNIKLST
jgi:glutaredoxin 3